jgi:hypothetical protein
MSNKGICKHEGCSGEVKGKGYCDRHYRQWRRGKLAKPRYRTCNAEGCRKPRARRGLCEEHFAKEFPGKAAKAAEAAGEASAAAPEASA